MIQLMYDWQNVGCQKQKFNQSDGTCPGCNDFETHFHYLSCGNEKITKARKEALKVLTKGLKKMNTFPGCIATIIEGISTDFKKATESIGLPKSQKELLLIEAAKNQYTLGNHTIFRGMIVKDWEPIQREWCRENGFRHNPRRWSIQLIKLLKHNY